VLTAPRQVPDANAGLYIPRYQVGGGARFRLTRTLDVGVLWDYGLDKGSAAIRDDLPEVNNGNVYGGGASVYYAPSIGDPRFSLGLGLDVMSYSVPYVEYASCVTTNCAQPFESIKRDRGSVLVGAVAITPSYRISPRLAAFAGVTARNHPTIPRSSLETASQRNDNPVEVGPVNVIVNAGLEYTFANGVRALAHVFQPVYAGPVRYGPTLGALLSIPLHRDARRPRAPAGARAAPATR